MNSHLTVKGRLLLLLFVPAVVALATLDLAFPALQTGQAGLIATLVPALWLTGWIVPLMHRSILGMAAFVVGHQTFFWLRIAQVNDYPLPYRLDLALRLLGAALMLFPMVKYAGREAQHAFERD